MKILLAAHGYPPELVGGTEVSLQSLARGLAARGHAVVVVAGSMQHEQGFRRSLAQDGPVRVHRIHRADLYFDHWQKSASARAAQAFTDVLREERPDLVHVHHWIRLTRDLVFLAAAEGIPAVVTLHDLWTSCLVTFRVRPDTKEFCEARLGPDPCLACARHVPPRTPWVSRENQHLALAEHRADVVRELSLARAVLAPTESHARAIAGYLGLDANELAIEAVPHGRDLALQRRAPRPLRPGGKLVLGAWGHLHPLKGQDLLLDALHRLPDPLLAALRLAGAAPDAGFEARLRVDVRELDVSFHGAYDAADLGRHPVTDVHAMISGTRAHESWGLVLDEAVALGLPMILPRAGAYAERLAEGRGALFYEPRNPASLARVLERLFAEADLLESVRAGLPPLADFAPSTAQHVEHVLTVYDRALRLGPPERPAVDWWRARMRQGQEEEWDASLKQRSAEELGFA